MDPDIKLEVDTTCRLSDVQLSNCQRKKPDLGARIFVYMPKKNCPADSPQWETYLTEYMGHGVHKTAFKLILPDAKFDGFLLKISEEHDPEPAVFMQTACHGFTTQIYYNCKGTEIGSSRPYHCWITDRTEPIKVGNEHCSDCFMFVLSVRCSEHVNS